MVLGFRVQGFRGSGRNCLPRYSGFFSMPQPCRECVWCLRGPLKESSLALDPVFDPGRSKVLASFEVWLYRGKIKWKLVTIMGYVGVKGSRA